MNVQEEQLQIVDWGPASNWDVFSIVSTNVFYKSLMFRHRVNNIEHNIKRNSYTGMEEISLMPS